MKKISTFLILACLTIGAMAQTEVPSQIEKVTIYPNSALVEKYVTVNLKKGENTFVIRSNADQIQNDAIHFASSPDWFVGSLTSQRSKISEAEFVARQLPGAAYTQYQALKAQQADITQKMSNTNKLISVLNMQADAIYNLKAVRNTVAFDTLVNLKAQIEYQRKEVQAINTALIKAQKENADYAEKIKQINNDIDKLLVQHTGSKRITDNSTDIFVTIYSNKAVTNAKIEYSYITTKVHCNYTYDVMLSEDTKQAVFSLKAAVDQQSGEHWKNCQLVFSTTDAGYAGYDRELPTYYLRAIQPQFARSMAKAAMARNTITAIAEMSMNEESVEPSYLDASVSYDQTLSREYVLNTHQAIYTFESAQTLMLHRDTTQVVFARFATPKNEEKVHFTALLPDWESLGLLNAECNVYLNNRFVSTSSVSTEGSTDTLRFSVGQDPNVQVRRKYTISTPDKTLLSKEITQTVTVTLSIKNTKNQPIVLRMKDQMPISADTEIKVLDINTCGGTINEKTGLIRWILDIKPLEQRDITFSYTVKYPKEKQGSVYLR